jgi:hypothetical protein
MPVSLPTSVPPDYVTSRQALHRVAAHVLAQRRHEVTGRFGLRATPGGFGTPQFGDPDHEETLRVAGPLLVREHRDGAGPHTDVVALDEATLGDLAAGAGVDLDPGFRVGTDTPDLGDVTAPLRIGVTAAQLVGDVLTVGAVALDRTLAELGAEAAPSVAQLWPEHFDLGLDVAVGGSRANLGLSLGDHYHDEPYAYVGPWGAERPGDAAYWNVGFGALLGYDGFATTGDPVDVIVAFFHRGLQLLAG